MAWLARRVDRLLVAGARAQPLGDDCARISASVADLHIVPLFSNRSAGPYGGAATH